MRTSRPEARELLKVLLGAFGREGLENRLHFLGGVGGGV